MNRFSMTRSPSWPLALMVAVLAWTAPARAVDDESSIRWTNGLHTQHLRFNALSANPSASVRMAQVALRSESYHLGSLGEPALKEQLADPSARAFMKYVVSCALGVGQVVDWMDRSGTVYQFEGHLALCPEWNGGPATVQCQRLVSACVLARNNADGRRVLLSGRGQKPIDPIVFAPRAEVRPDPFVRFTSTRVPSTVACSVPEYGIHRNCGLKAERVGVCTPGARVQVGAGGRTPDLTCGSLPLGTTVEGTMVLRVCDGLAACDDAGALAQSDGTCGTFLPAVSFTCPVGGTFSVFSGSYNSEEPGKAEVAVLSATYPATEKQTFSLREGAFFGNLFEPGSLAPGVNVYVDDAGELHKDVDKLAVPGSIYTKMYACQDPKWDNAAAYANERLCTLSGTNCVAKAVGRCDALVPSGPYAGLKRCQLEDATGHNDYTQCAGTAGDMYQQVVTPHLNQACDIVTAPFACALETGTPGTVP